MNTINGIVIAGHTYNVEVDNKGKITKTECVGRWPMTDVNVGDDWLMKELQKKVNEFGVAESACE